MIFRVIDGSGDWRFGKGLNDYASGEQALELNLRTTLLSWVGDCFFALQDGIDWKNRLDIGQKNTLIDEIKSRILQAEGVVGINSVDASIDPKTRRARITYDIQTIYSRSFSATVDQAAGVN